MACPVFAAFHSGEDMPLLGYGTWQAAEGELEPALDKALDCGYRHIDTASFYGNEGVIGKVLEDWFEAGKLSREDVFLVTKLPPSGMRASSVRAWLDRSLAALRVAYLDLYLVHTPFGLKERGEEVLPLDDDGQIMWDYDTDHVAVWKALEDEVDAGRVKAIGVSNFDQRQIQRILDNCRIKPANLQIELHVYMQQRPLVEFCHENGITVTAYSPLGSRGTEKMYDAAGKEREWPNLMSNPVVMEVAERLNKTASQVLLKHIVQRGIAAIPKSTNEDRIAQNIHVFDFELSAEDVAKLDALDQGEAGRIIDFDFLPGIKTHPEFTY